MHLKTKTEEFIEKKCRTPQCHNLLPKWCIIFLPTILTILLTSSLTYIEFLVGFCTLTITKRGGAWRIYSKPFSAFISPKRFQKTTEVE